MKFRGRIGDIRLMQLFTRTINTISKQTKELTLRFTKSHLYLISNQEDLEDCTRTWSEIPTAALFIEYTMAGVSTQCNEIYMNCSADNLFSILRMVNQQSKSLRLKLTKKFTLQITIEQSKIGHSNIDVVYHVPVKLVSRKYWSTYEEISIPIADVTFHFPRLGYLRNLLEKGKSLSKHVDLEVQNGELRVKVANMWYEMETIFNDIQVQECSGEKAHICVDLRRLSSFFSSLTTNDNFKILVRLVNEHMLHFSYMQDQILVFFVLAHQSIND